LTTWPKRALAITAFPIPGWSKDRPVRGRAFLDGRRRDHSARKVGNLISKETIWTTNSPKKHHVYPSLPGLGG
jgi:hypothetical protein